MNNSGNSLDRLLRAAGSHRPANAAEEAPYGFATQVAALWVAGMGQQPSWKAELMWLRRALFCALTVMAISVGWSFKTVTAAAPSEEMTLASYDASADLP
jgi:hypothetical protein